MDTKKLRQKILDLAIHGKLVPQDPTDEPASVLLERIKAEKERLIKEGKIKRSKKSAKTSDTPHYENVPFEIPNNWVWTTVAEISKSILYGVNESAKICGAYKLLRITDIQEDNVDWDTVPFTNYDESKVGVYLLEENDILFARTGATVGKSYLVKGLCESSIYASYLIRVQTFKEILPQYVKYFFESGFYWEQIERGSVGIGQPNVNGTTLGNLRLPIPPINEQERIVSELKKWIAVITSIEANKNDLQGYIESAKSKILDLAIHGKLVPQDPNDEPAVDLLRRINPKFTPCDNGHYTQLPEGWAICKMKQITSITNGKSQKNVETLNGIYPIYGSGGVIGRANQYLCIAGSTIIGRKGTINNPIFVEEHFWNVDTAFGLKANDAILDKYLYYFCLSFDFSKLDKSTAMPSLTKTSIGNVLIPIPPYKEQERIVAKIDMVLDTMNEILRAV